MMNCSPVGILLTQSRLEFPMFIMVQFLAPGSINMSVCRVVSPLCIIHEEIRDFTNGALTIYNFFLFFKSFSLRQEEKILIC